MIAGTVSVAWDDQASHWSVEITPPDGEPVSHVMVADPDETGATWPMPAPATRPGDGYDATSWDRSGADFRKLADAVATRKATAKEAVDYGRHLFEALLGPAGWAALDTPKAGRPLVVQLRWEPGPLHRFVWELMHDGHDYLALRGSAPVVFVRLVGPDDATGPATITRPPRVLFAVGCALNDSRVRAGAEIMGLLREFERGAGLNGTAVLARVLTNASLTRLRSGYEELDPDVVHLIGHGRWDAHEKLGKLTLASDSAAGRRSSPADGEEHTAAELVAALSRSAPDPAVSHERSTPTLVVVSACESGVASTGAGLPLGAQLAVPDLYPLGGRLGVPRQGLHQRARCRPVRDVRVRQGHAAEGRLGVACHLPPGSTTCGVHARRHGSRGGGADRYPAA